MSTVEEIKAALDAATPGEWKWHSVLAPYELPDSAMSAGDLRVETPTPDEFFDAQIDFVIQAMKHGHVLMRKADAELIANAPAWLRTLLAERERMAAVVEAAANVRLYVDGMIRGAELEADERQALEAMVAALAAYEEGGA